MERPQSTPPAGDLGPRVTAEWRLGPGNTVVEYLYLSAEGGPMGHIPGGQELYGEVIQEAWFPLAPDIAERLAAVGFYLTSLDMEVVLANEGPSPPASPVTTVAAESAPPTTAANSARIAPDVVLPVSVDSEPVTTQSGWRPAWSAAFIAIVAAGAVVALSGIMWRRTRRMA